jgi:hypothetical protein
MQRRILATIGALALVSCYVTGCGQQAKQDGFIDKTGQLVVDPSKTTQRPLVFGDYSEGFVPAKFSTGYGCLDKDGGLAFVHPFRYIAPFSEGMAAFSVGKNAAEELWGYINNTGETVIEPTYGGAGDFSEGMAAVRTHKDDKGAKFPGKWCYIDKTGKPVIDKYFDEAQPFVDGLAVVKQNGKMGCIDKTGKFIVPASYDKVYPVNAGVIVAAQGDGISEDNRDQTLDYFDIAGIRFCQKTMTPVPLKNLRHRIWVLNEFKVGDAAVEADRKLSRPLSNDASPGFHEGYGIMQIGKKFAHMTPKFQMPGFANVYDYVFPFSDGMALVYQDSAGGKLGYVDSTQNLIIPYKYWDASPFSNGVALVQETKDGLYGYIDKKGKYILPPAYENARPFKDDRALVGKSALLQPEP